MLRHTFKLKCAQEKTEVVSIPLAQRNILKRNQTKEFGYDTIIFEKFKKKMYDFMYPKMGLLRPSRGRGEVGLDQALPTPCPLIYTSFSVIFILKKN